MKKYLSIFTLIFLLSGCKNDQTVISPQIYHEVETNFTDETIYDLNLRTLITDEMIRLEENGEIFRYDSDQQISIRTSMTYLSQNLTLDELNSPPLTGLRIHKDDTNTEFEIDESSCNQDNMCLITEPLFSKTLVADLGRIDSFYGWNGEIYTIGMKKDNENYSIFKGEEEIFSHRMFPGSGGVIQDASIIMNSPAFTIYLENAKENDPDLDIFYKGETFNEKHHVDGSSYLFSYKDKIGFVAQKDGKTFFMFDDQKITEDFDQITTYGCCEMPEWPVEVDANGILFFMAKRGEKYLLVEVDLKEYIEE